MSISDPSGDVDPIILRVKGLVESQHFQSILPISLELAENTLAADK